MGEWRIFVSRNKGTDRETDGVLPAWSVSIVKAPTGGEGLRGLVTCQDAARRPTRDGITKLLYNKHRLGLGDPRSCLSIRGLCDRKERRR